MNFSILHIKTYNTYLLHYNYTVVKNQPSQLYRHSRETGQSEMDFSAK